MSDDTEIKIAAEVDSIMRQLGKRPYDDEYREMRYAVEMGYRRGRIDARSEDIASLTSLISAPEPQSLRA